MWVKEVHSAILVQFLLILTGILQPNRVDALRVLFATPCFRGHLTPSGGIARALINAGHQVTTPLLKMLEHFAYPYMTHFVVSRGGPPVGVIFAHWSFTGGCHHNMCHY